MNRYADAPNNSIAIGDEYEKFVVAIIKERYGKEIHVYQDKYSQINIGESIEGVEIKYDGRSADTGRLSIEVCEKKNQTTSWVKSGIQREDNTILYVQGNYDFFFVFQKSKLRSWSDEQKKNGVRPEQYNGTIARLWLPFSDAIQICRYYERVGLQGWMVPHIEQLNK